MYSAYVYHNYVPQHFMHSLQFMIIRKFHDHNFMTIIIVTKLSFDIITVYKINV